MQFANAIIKDREGKGLRPKPPITTITEVNPVAVNSQILGAYADFVMTDSWGDDLARLEAVNPAAAELVGKYGIGSRLKEDGSYDWESGQLLDDVPSHLRDTIGDDEEAMSIVHDIAYGYEFYAKSLLERA